MSVRAYAEINFHITWHTKNNFPFITPHLEPDLYAFIKDRIVRMPNVHFHGIGGIQTHIHLAASFQPPFEIDRWIGEVKGASSHEFGRQLQWQSGYGIVSFGTKDLDWYVRTFEIKKNITELERSTNDSNVFMLKTRARALKRPEHLFSRFTTP